MAALPSGLRPPEDPAPDPRRSGATHHRDQSGGVALNFEAETLRRIRKAIASRKAVEAVDGPALSAIAAHIEHQAKQLAKDAEIERK